MKNKLIKINGISHTYDEKNYVLKNINLEIYENEIIALFGPSGSGKSTLLHIMGNLMKPVSGNIEYQYKPINLKTGFIFQSFNMIKELTLYENIKIAQLKRGYDEDNEIYVFAERTGVSEYLGKYPSEVSTGQLQRAALIRAVVGKTETVLCDEPTGALDTENKINLMKIISEISSERTFFIVSHDNIIKDYCDRVIMIKDGEITQEV